LTSVNSAGSVDEEKYLEKTTTLVTDNKLRSTPNQSEKHSYQTVLKSHPLLLDLNKPEAQTNICERVLHPNAQKEKNSSKIDTKHLINHTKAVSCSQTVRLSAYPNSGTDFNMYADAYNKNLVAAQTANKNNNNNQLIGYDECYKTESDVDGSTGIDSFEQLNVNNNCNNGRIREECGGIKLKYFDSLCESQKKAAKKTEKHAHPVTHYENETANRCASEKVPDHIIEKKLNRANKVFKKIT
jgi:hypothetical protein